MPQNERLRAAMLETGMTIGDLAQAAGVDPKTCERWITTGRIPHRVNAKRASLALREDMSYLWPELESGRSKPGTHPELIALYATRADAPMQLWRVLFEQAERSIAILVYAAVFLHELWPDFNRLLRDKALQGCRVQVLLGDPDSEAVTRRGQEEKYGHGIETRCRQALMHYAPLIGVEGIDIRQHSTSLYNSIYIGDETMIVNVHRFGINAYATPVMHLRRASQGGLFDGYAESFEYVRQLSYPVRQK